MNSMLVRDTQGEWWAKYWISVPPLRKCRCHFPSLVTVRVMSELRQTGFYRLWMEVPKGQLNYSQHKEKLFSVKEQGYFSKSTFTYLWNLWIWSIFNHCSTGRTKTPFTVLIFCSIRTLPCLIKIYLELGIHIRKWYCRTFERWP